MSVTIQKKKSGKHRSQEIKAARKKAKKIARNRKRAGKPEIH